jgi:hypothetical protein
VNRNRKAEFAEIYRKHLAVPLAGFGMAALLLCLFLLLMTWLSAQVHHLQFCLSRFGH